MIFGDVVSRVSLEDCWGTREQARKAMWKWLNDADAKAINLEALDRYLSRITRDFEELRGKLLHNGE